MSAWDPDKLEKRVTEVADEVGKLAEAIADIGSPGQGIGVRAVGEVSVLVEGVGHDCRMPGARVAEIDRDLRLLAERESSFLRRPTGKWLMRHIYG